MKIEKEEREEKGVKKKIGRRKIEMFFDDGLLF